MTDNRTKSGRKAGDKSDLLTKQEMEKLFSVVAGDLYFTTLYTVLRYSGRRISEIYNLKLKDINFTERSIKTIILKRHKQKIKRICSTCNKKEMNYKIKFCGECGNKLEEAYSFIKRTNPIERELIMRDEIYNILNLFIHNHKPKFKDEDYIFREKSLIQLKKKIKYHIKQTEINKKFSLHGFRYYFISNLIRAGMTESQIIKVTGHTSTSSLTSYNLLIGKDVKDKVNSAEL